MYYYYNIFKSQHELLIQQRKTRKVKSDNVEMSYLQALLHMCKYTWSERVEVGSF